MPFLRKPLKNELQTTQMGEGSRRRKKRQPQDAGVQITPTLDWSRRILGFSRKEENQTKRTVSAPVELVIGKRVAEH